jgi:D-alanyl-D-alanine carboxypeptidase
MRVDTPMRIASIGKLFTIVSVFQLVETGKLDLDAPLYRYLPDYPNPDVARKVTLQQLLSHTAGTGDIFGAEGFAHRDELKELGDYTKVFGNRALTFEPGSKWDYSNYGYILLGLVIERVSGETYYNYVRRHVFSAAGMRETTYPVEDEQYRPPSANYTHMSFGPGGPRNDLQLSRVEGEPHRGTSAGGAFSTVGDLDRFANALLDGRLVSRQTLTKLFDPTRVPGGVNNKYGVEIGADSSGRTWFGHRGGSPGTDGQLRIYQDQHLDIAVLSNLDSPSAATAAEEAAALIR